MKRALLLSLIVAAGGCGQPTAAVDMGGTNNDFSGGGDTPDMAKPDMAIAIPQGTKMVAGSYFIWGITDDNQVVAEDLNNGNKLIAVPVDGKTAATISAGAWRFTMHGKAVFDWENADMTTNIGQGNIWTAAGGLKPFMNSETSISGLADLSPDGNWIYYSVNAAVDGSSSDFYVAKSDTTAPIKFATGTLTDITMDTTQCSSHAEFTSGNKLVVLACGLGKGGGGANALWVVDPATGKVTSLSEDVNNWYTLDPMGKFVASTNKKGDVTIYPLDGTTPIPAGTDISPAEGFFTPDGSALIYCTNAGALNRVPAMAGAKVAVLVATNVNHIRLFNINRRILPGFSPDSKWVIVSDKFDDTSGYGDISMASTTMAGMPTVLVPTATGEIFGDAFTQDSAYVLYYTDISTVTISSGQGLIGTFNAKPVTGGAAAIVAKKVWVSYDGPGSISAYNDNYRSGKNYGRGDLRIVDIKDTSKNFLVSAQAEGEFWPTPDRKTFVYSTTLNPVSNAMYSIPAKVQ